MWSERLNRLTIGGIVIAFIGIILVNYGGFTFGSQTILGNILALIAGFAMGAYLIIGRQLRAHIDILSYLTIIYSCAAVILLIATVISGYSLLGYSPITYSMMILLALVPQLIGHSCLNLAVRLISTTLVSVAILGESVGATLLGVLILNEIPTVNEIVGGVLVIGGIFMVMIKSAIS
jgi:drug/metabolite transporter (DMT)-like permease